MRVAALEDNVAFLEQWCEEQQDALDRTPGSLGYDFEVEDPEVPMARALLRVVDLRESPRGGEWAEAETNDDSLVAVVESEHERRIRQLRGQINRLRTRLALTVAPAEQAPAPRRAAGKGEGRGAAVPGKISAKPAGRTAP